jgi:hypothetical protein
MIPRQTIDLDSVSADLLCDMAHAVNGWAHGEPRDETALMNRITERLSRRRRQCDVGVDHPVEVTADFAALHRRGPSQTDQFGSDLATTVRIPQLNFIKTAFFQLKVSEHYKAQVERKQLRQTTLFPGVQERCFVLAVDDPGCGYRIRPASECMRDIPPGQQAKEFDTSNWEFLSEWIIAWFECQRGLPSDENDANSVEKMLQQYKHALQRDLFDHTVMANLPREVLPAKGWLTYIFRRKDH